VEALARQLGGRIERESGASGTAVRLTLPWREPGSEPGSRPGT
jgi:hypothetical protein